MDDAAALAPCFAAESSVFQSCEFLSLVTMKAKFAKPPTQLTLRLRTLAKRYQPSPALERPFTLFRRADFRGNYCRYAAVHYDK